MALLVAGCGDDQTDGSFGSDLIKHVDVVTKGGDFRGAVDATASPDGRMVYFTATSSKGPGVFQVPARGGEVVPVVTGPPFRAPVGVAVSTDGRRLLVADPDGSAPSGAGGAVFSVDVTSRAPTPVPGTERTAPRGVEVVREGTGDALYFTGKDPTEGAAAVFKVPASGSPARAVVAKGTPLTDLDAVTATRGGVVYVTDRGRPDTARGAVYRIRDGTAERIADIRAPRLAGVTLTIDESVLLVSSLSDQGRDQVLVIDLATLRSGVFNETIGANRQGGGLHRAHDVDLFAWADFTAGPDRASRVYVLRP